MVAKDCVLPPFKEYSQTSSVPATSAELPSVNVVLVRELGVNGLATGHNCVLLGTIESGSFGAVAPIATFIVIVEILEETLLGQGSEINGSKIDAVIDLGPFVVHSTTTNDVLVFTLLKTPPTTVQEAVNVL